VEVPEALQGVPIPSNPDLKQWSEEDKAKWNAMSPDQKKQCVANRPNVGQIANAEAQNASADSLKTLRANQIESTKHYELRAAEFGRRPHRSRISRTLFLAARRLVLALSIASSVTAWALPGVPS
jgi:hypothetical protein